MNLVIIGGFVVALGDGGTIISLGSSSILSSYLFTISLACSIVIGLSYIILCRISCFIPEWSALATIYQCHRWLRYQNSPFEFEPWSNLSLDLPPQFLWLSKVVSNLLISSFAQLVISIMWVEYFSRGANSLRNLSWTWSHEFRTISSNFSYHRCASPSRKVGRNYVHYAFVANPFQMHDLLNSYTNAWASSWDWAAKTRILLRTKRLL